MSPKPLEPLRRSEWRRQADDPKMPIGWWAKGTFRKRNLHWLFLWPTLGAAWVGLLGAGWWMLAMSLLAWSVVRTFRINEWDPLRNLLPDPPPPGQFRASVAYRRDGVQTGTDEMALTVVDGWLYAEGVRSHFSFRREDVRDLRTGSDRRGRLALPDGAEVLLAGIDDAARIVLERWWQSKALGGGAPTFPPASVHPEEYAKRTMGMIASFLPLLTGFLGWSLSHDPIVGSLIGVVGFFSFMILGARAGDRLGRLARIGRQSNAGAERDALTEQVPPLQGPAEEVNVHAA